MSSTPRIPRRILVADRNAHAARSLAERLRTMGHDVYKACGLHAAVELTCEIFPEFVLLDISVPSFDGLQLARRIRQLQLARQPFIVAATAWGGARAIG